MFEKKIPREQVVKILRFLSKRMDKNTVVLFPNHQMIKLGEHNIPELLYFISDMLE